MGIERHRWASREAEMSGSERVNITEDVRKYAAQHKLTDEQALQTGMEEKSREFNGAGAEIYSKA
jgi:phage terminase Nu1 subunit (DNA packaging protein)